MKIKSSAEQAIAILAVDNIKLTKVGHDLLQRREKGEISHEEAIEEIKKQAKAFSDKD